MTQLPGFSERLLRCSQHATEPVWASDHQSGMYSRRRLPTLPCKDCGAMTAVTARKDNWRKYRIADVVEDGRLFACRRCFPKLGSFLDEFWGVAP